MIKRKEQQGMEDSMNGFAERRKAFEAKYHHDDELKFKIHAKCCHFFALWVVEVLQFKGKNADLYAEEIIVIQIQQANFENLLEKVLRDFEKAEVKTSRHRLEKKWEKCWDQAHAYIMTKEKDNL